MSHHAQAASYYHASSIPAKKPQPNHGHTWSCAPAKSQKYDIFSYLCCRSQTIADVPSSKICVRLTNFHYPGWETRRATPHGHPTVAAPARNRASTTIFLILPAVSEPSQMSHHPQTASYYHACSTSAKKPQPNRGHTWSCAPAKSQKYDIFSYLCCRSQTIADVPSPKICAEGTNFRFPGWRTRQATPQQWPHPHQIW